MGAEAELGRVQQFDRSQPGRRMDRMRFGTDLLPTLRHFPDIAVATMCCEKLLVGF